VLWLYPLTAASLYYAGVFRATEERHGSGTSSGVGGSSGEKSYRAMMAKGVTEVRFPIYPLSQCVQSCPLKSNADHSWVHQSYRALILLNYLVVMLAIKQVPYLGIVGFTYASIVDAYYVYEASWIKQGLSLSERVQALDSRWSYFFGFGLPITFVSYWSNDPIVNLALFSLAFPLAQITASSSIPQPLDPKIPTSSLSLSCVSPPSSPPIPLTPATRFLPQAQGSFALSNAEGGEEARGRRGNPYVPIRIPVLFLADKLYALLNKNLGSKKKDAGGGGGGAYGGNGYGVVNGHGHGNGRIVGGMGRQPPMASTAPATRYHAPPPLSSATPPRRGHTMTESSVGVGMGGMPLAGVQGVGMEPRREFEDRKLDSLISAAARRKKGD
jgi:hypothetical protein